MKSGATKRKRELNKQGDGVAEGCGGVSAGRAARSVAVGNGVPTGGGVLGGRAVERGGVSGGSGGHARRRKRGGSASELVSTMAVKYLLDHGVFFHQIVEKTKSPAEERGFYSFFRLMEKHKVSPARVERHVRSLHYFWRVADLERVVRLELSCQRAAHDDKTMVVSTEDACRIVEQECNRCLIHHITVSPPMFRELARRAKLKPFSMRGRFVFWRRDELERKIKTGAIPELVDAHIGMLIVRANVPGMCNSTRGDFAEMMRVMGVKPWAETSFPNQHKTFWRLKDALRGIKKWKAELKGAVKK